MHRLRLAVRNGILRIGQDDHVGFSVRYGDDVICRRRRGVLSRRFDVRKDLGIVDRPRLGAGMPADDFNPKGDGTFDRDLLPGRVEAAEHDTVGLERDRPIGRSSLAGNGSLRIDDLAAPADGFGRLDDAIADAERAAVLLVRGNVNDKLIRLRLRTARRTIPRTRRSFPKNARPPTRCCPGTFPLRMPS